MQIADLMYKYKDVQPKNFGDFGERCYPASAVIEMLNEQKQALLQCDVSGSLPPYALMALKTIALADDEMVKNPDAAVEYRHIVREVLEFYGGNDR